ncbi:hypothetical protein [Mesorhizobium qingshengii]|uniref:Uncharacterized protein n=1 Tax=Mesorhizobium qingshengii TaxID=1165689 RepID=A0A1G5V226_9HYPH|nr:hypothetical protein [Mesorhizobium qingshengii]SDA39317.1 hypothetical protein SAMN02927914_00134 [Mesorhizobium qingshengii]
MGATAWLLFKTWVLPVLTFGVTLPVWAFLAGGAWLWIDKVSAVRQAVDKAVTELVAGAQLDALQAEVTEQRRLRAWSDGKADEAGKIAADERSARVTLETTLTLTDAEKRKAEDDLAALQARDDGLVDQQLLDSLHNR